MEEVHQGDEGQGRGLVERHMRGVRHRDVQPMWFECQKSLVQWMWESQVRKICSKVWGDRVMSLTDVLVRLALGYHFQDDSR